MDDPLELLRQLQERDRAARTHGAAEARLAAAAAAAGERRASEELAVLVELLEKGRVPTKPLYRFKKKRMRWNSDYEVFTRVDSVWHITAIPGEDGAVDRHWVLNGRAELFGPVDPVPRRADRQEVPDGPGYELNRWESTPAPLPATEFFIHRGHLGNPRWKLGQSAQETADIYHLVIDANTPRG